MINDTHITLRFYLLKRRKNTSGKYPIYLRITRNRKYRLLSTGISVMASQWDKKKLKVKDHPEAKSLNIMLDEFLLEARKKLNELPAQSQTTRALKEELKKTDHKLKQSDFFDFAERFIDEMEKKDRFWAFKHTKSTVGLFKIYNKNKNLLFEDITPALLEGFQDWLKLERKNVDNTINKHFQGIKRLFNKALDDEITTNNPFLKFKPVSKKRTEKTRLPLEHIIAIQELKLKPGTSLDHARDTFLFSFYNAGIRFGDLSILKWKHIVDGRLKYNMSKSRSGKNIKLLKPALDILDKYRTETSTSEDFIFPILDPRRDYSKTFFLKKQIQSKNFIFSRNIKKLAEMAGIEENVSFHVSRHSFADYARTSGMNLYDISKALAHSDISVTQRYLKSFDEISLDASMKALFPDS